jgi:hypothetical protein
MTKRAKGNRPQACSDACARDYDAQKKAVVALVERLSKAARGDFDRAFAKVDGPKIHFGHVGELGRVRELLREVSDLVFREGEYAEPGDDKS